MLRTKERSGVDKKAVIDRVVDEFVSAPFYLEDPRETFGQIFDAGLARHDGEFLLTSQTSDWLSLLSSLSDNKNAFREMDRIGPSLKEVFL